MTSEWCATMWLPRPITQRSPIRSTGTGPRSWPGTIPADRLTWAPIRVPSPIMIQRSPKTEPGGNAAIEPRPNAANFRPAGVSAVTTPARCAVCKAQCTARQRSSRSQDPRLICWPEAVVAEAEAASWPQAPSISRPRVSRTVTGTPCASRRRTNSRCAAGRDAVHFDPGVGLSGIRLTWASRPASSEPSRSARQAWSLMSLIRAYSMETRRPVAAA